MRGSATWTPRASPSSSAPTGWALLSALPPYDESRTMALSARLREEGLDPVLVAAALTQSRLRAKAVAKFGDFAGGMLFTAAGLEQATRLKVAAHHARRYRDAGSTRVADLTCGIGADAMAFAGIGLRVLATDVDEATAAIATVNLRHFPDAEVRHGDGLALDLEGEGVDGVYADPARRTSSGSRVFDPSAYEPALDRVLELRERGPRARAQARPGHPPLGAARSTRTRSGCRWTATWSSWACGSGRSRPRAPGRSALVLRDGQAHTILASNPDGIYRPPSGAVGAYLYEPDGAVIRAGLVGELADQVRGRLVDPTIAYVTSDVLTPVPTATAYRVLDTMPFGLKRLKTYLRERDVGRLTIKKRGTAVVPEQLRRQLDLRGSAFATIVLTRVAGSQQVLVVEAA